MNRVRAVLLVLCLAWAGTLTAGGLAGAGQLDRIYTGSFALVIGASDYAETPWESLPGVRDDTEQVSAMLEEIGFTVEQVPPPRTRENIRRAGLRLSRLNTEADLDTFAEVQSLWRLLNQPESKLERSSIPRTATVLDDFFRRK